MIVTTRLERATPPETCEDIQLLRALFAALDGEHRARSTRSGVHRRALERALHDGTQQRLLGLRIALTHVQESPRGSRTANPSAEREHFLALLHDVSDELMRLASGEAVAAVDVGHGGAETGSGDRPAGLVHRAERLPEHVRAPRSPDAAALPLTPMGRPARDELASWTGDRDLSLWFWCGLAGFRDEEGRRRPDGHDASRWQIRVDLPDDPFVFIETQVAFDDAAAWVEDRFAAFADGQRRARCAVARRRIELERALIDQRWRATDRLISDRLASRSMAPLRAAHLVLQHASAEGFQAACREASTLIGESTDEIRLLVRCIRSMNDQPDDGVVPLSDVLEAAAHRAKVECRVIAAELADRTTAAEVERIAEEVMFAAGRGARMRLEIRERAVAVHLRFRLDRFPEPAQVSLIEHAVVSAGGSVSCGPAERGVRVDVELPCGS